jgi:prophage antirepressor-like protein
MNMERGVKMELKLVKQGEFNGQTCDFYKDNNDKEIWMTREQIGKALGYEYPRKAIGKIHNRNKDRLDRFSTGVKLTPVEGSREVERETILYSPKGVYEICRFSRQPKADAFMDWVWDVIEQLRAGQSQLMSSEIIQLLIREVVPAVIRETVKAIIPEINKTMNNYYTHQKSNHPRIDSMHFTGFDAEGRAFETFHIWNKCKIETFPASVKGMVDEMISRRDVNFSEIARILTVQGYPITSPSVKRYFDRKNNSER